MAVYTQLAAEALQALIACYEVGELVSAKGIAEIETSKLALEKSSHAEVKKFAQTMIDDHTRANDELKALAKKKNLEVSDDAELMSKAPEGAVGVKLSTPRRGCSGLAYSVDYVTEAKPFDEKIETPGGLFFVDAGSILYLIGSRMDWREDDFTAGFVFDNPNAKGACGCGESFTV